VGPISLKHHFFLGFIGAVMVLAGCEPTSQTKSPAPNLQPKSVDNDVLSKTENDDQPALAINELQNGLIPAAPQMGELAIRNNCIVFIMRDQIATPLWPAGTTLGQQSNNLFIKIPGRADLMVPSTASIGGAFVPLNSANMTKYSKPLPEGCPSATFAVAKQ
jgi:hypothetical protein